MLPTGNVPAGLRKLEALLRTIRFPGDVDYCGLSSGAPSAFLPIISFVLTSFSPPFAEQLLAAGLELSGKNDLRFTETFYKVLREVFSYRPVLSTQQFLQRGFCQRKLSTVCDIITMVMERHQQLRKPRVRVPAVHTDHRGKVSSPPSSTEVGAVVMEIRPVVPSLRTPYSPSKHRHEEAATPQDGPAPSQAEPHSPENGGGRLPGGGGGGGGGGSEGASSTAEAAEEVPGPPAAEAQLHTLLSALDKLSMLEERLEELERRSHAATSGEAVVMVTREKWENLTNRVLLLETKLELNNSLRRPSPPPWSSASASSPR